MPSMCISIRHEHITAMYSFNHLTLQEFLTALHRYIPVPAEWPQVLFNNTFVRVVGRGVLNLYFSVDIVKKNIFPLPDYNIAEGQ